MWAFIVVFCVIFVSIGIAMGPIRRNARPEPHGVFFRAHKREFQDDQEIGEERNSRKRNRRKGKQTGGKKTSTQAASSQAATSAGQPAERSVRKEEALARKQALKDQEWPALRAKAMAERDPELLDVREDLAVLHADLMEAKQKHAPTVAMSAARGGQKPKTGRICVGDQVEARFDGGLEWFPATVTKTLPGGLVNLAYDDGEKESKVHTSLLRRPGLGAGPPSDEETDSEPEEFVQGPPRGASSVRHQRQRRSDWEVQNRKVRKAPEQRVEARAEANTNLKNRTKRQKKREKEIAAREALRKKL